MNFGIRKLCVIFTEGETDHIFYQYLIDLYRKKNPKIEMEIVRHNIKGITRFQNKLLCCYKNDIAIKYSNYEHYIFLTYDTDVFEYSANPPVNWQKLEKKLLLEGVKGVFHIKAERSIEDWFLIDKEGICKNLRIPLNTKISGDSGFKKINSLFKKANKVYSKGKESTEVISKLDIEKIRNKVSNQLKDLENFLGIN